MLAGQQPTLEYTGRMFFRRFMSFVSRPKRCTWTHRKDYSWQLCERKYLSTPPGGSSLYSSLTKGKHCGHANCCDDEAAFFDTTLSNIAASYQEDVWWKLNMTLVKRWRWKIRSDCAERVKSRMLQRQTFLFPIIFACTDSLSWTANQRDFSPSHWPKSRQQGLTRANDAGHSRATDVHRWRRHANMLVVTIRTC